MKPVLLYCSIYAGIAVFLAGCVVRVLQYAKAPAHLRWELHPVPHGKMGQLKVMIPEIALMKALREANRALWYRSFPFHFGLYLLALTTVLVLIAALLPIGDGATSLLREIYRATGITGLIVGTLGVLGLLSRRLIDREMRSYTTAGDLFNLLLFAVTFGFLLHAALAPPPGVPGMTGVVRGALQFDTAIEPPTALLTGLMLGSFLLAYIPMTHMSHFIAKYFTYHSVRWDEHPNSPGSAMERQMGVYLGHRPTWAASHIGADGARTWADIATTNPAKGGGR